MSSSDIAPNEAAYLDDVQPERLRQTGWVRSLVLLLMLGEFLGLADVVSPPHKHILGLFGGSAPFLSSALLGAFLIFLSQRPSLKVGVVATIVGIGLEFYLASIRGPQGLSPYNLLLNCGTGLGLTAIAVQLFYARYSIRADRHLLQNMLLLPGFIAASTSMIGLTRILHPRVYDASVYMLDSAFTGSPSFAIAAAVSGLPYLKGLLIIVYMHLPAAAACIFALVNGGRVKSHTRILDAFVWVGLGGFVLYHVVPVVGPTYFFRSDFPLQPPSPEKMKSLQYLAIPEYRNCFPSLHTAWALVIFHYARPLGRLPVLLSGGFVLMTLTATIGLGLHYIIDLFAAAPFVMVVLASIHRPTRWRHWSLVGTACFLCWCVAVIFGADLGRDYPTIVLALSAITLALYMRASLEIKVGAETSGDYKATQPTPAKDLRRERWLVPMFFASGFAALVYQVVFAKALGLTFGSMGTASATVLTAFMAGIAVGSWLGGRLADGRHDPIKIYLVCEIGIAIWCVLTPVLFDTVRAQYIEFASGGDPAAPKLVLVQLLLGLAILMPPTVLMGMTLPVLTAYLERSSIGFGSVVGRLYAANTVGAAAGALLTGYFLLPTFGSKATTSLAVVLNLMAALAANWLSKQEDHHAKNQTDLALRPPTVEKDDDEVVSSVRLTEGRVAIFVLFVGGILTLALESTYIHLLAVVAGNSAYAFSLMLFAFLIGLGGGAQLSRLALDRGIRASIGLATAYLGIAALIIAGLFWWDQIPAYFDSFAQYNETKTFEKREFVRFVACALTMLPVSTLIGAAFPFAMEMVGGAWPKARIRALGRAAAANTAGNIIGALVGGFILIPMFGSFSTLELIAGIALGLGAVTVWTLPDRVRVRLLLPMVAVMAMYPILPDGFDMDRLASGANVYFKSHGYGDVVDYAESLDGGLTTVQRSDHPVDGRVYTLLTNGKFQGDSSDDREMKAQVGFGLVPMFHSSQTDRGLVIGLGTGVTARALHDGGVKHVDIVELSGDLLRLAKTYFSKKNGGVLERANVQSYVTDGRNFLMLTKKRYDLISIELSSIWFAGAAALYNSEFYQLAKKALTDDGVLQQWIQLHRLSTRDLVSIVATIRNEFNDVWLYEVGGQGMLIACMKPCPITETNRMRLRTAPDLTPLLELFGGKLPDVEASRLLKPRELDRFLIGMRDFGLNAEMLLSTDDNHLLEYSTPKANVRPYRESMIENLNLFRQYQRRGSKR